jgi:CubicO group peptidase (beta-lactamase class C family)
VPGVSVAVFRDGRIEWTRGWGYADVEAKRKVERDTRFQAASISKPVAAAAVLALVSRGRLSLDGPINAHLTSWKLPDNEFTAGRPVTLRHLLTHSAGTTVHGFRGYAQGEEVPTLVQLLDGMKPANSAAVRVDIPVGSRWRYSGGGISIAQLAVEDETQRPFAQTARELVLAPFGMTNSTFVQPIPADLRDKAATGYRASGTAVAGRYHTYPEQAAAGLWTTAEDLAKFAIELQRVATGKTGKVMSRAIAEDMLRRQVDDWGLGVGVLGDGAATRFSHGGANQGFRAFWVGYRERGSGVVVMTNGDHGSALASDIVRTVAREYGFAGLGPVERTMGTADPATYGDFAGVYDMPGRTPPFLQVIAEGERLFRSTGPRPEQRGELLPESADTFFALDDDLRIRFVRDARGRVTEARLIQGTEERTATRR